jgi:glycosyltransferase involved in cell wall biosynthesis
MIRISIIIPVYNASQFLEKAIESALCQPQTGEVILIDDGSTDTSYEICCKIAADNPKIILLTHPNRENHGAGASRNLGLKQARFPFIAFLDADDYYLPNRFKKTEEIFQKNSNAEGVYEACGFEFHSESAKQYEIKDAGIKEELIQTHKYTINEEISPQDFFYRWVKGNIGFFITNGLTFKKSLIGKTGFMDTELRLHQDTEFYYRLAAVGQLMPGNIKNPVAIIGRHDRNRITKRTRKDAIYQVLVWRKLLLFVIKNLNIIDKRAIKYVVKNRATFYNSTYLLKNRYLRFSIRIFNWIKILFRYPILIKYLIIKEK